MADEKSSEVKKREKERGAVERNTGKAIWNF